MQHGMVSRHSRLCVHVTAKPAVVPARMPAQLYPRPTAAHVRYPAYPLQATVLGMMELKEFPTFKQHVRDFLVQVRVVQYCHTLCTTVRCLPSVCVCVVLPPSSPCVGMGGCVGVWVCVSV